jgi:hypothetical protein
MDYRGLLLIFGSLLLASVAIWIGRPGRKRRRYFLQFTYLGPDSFKIKSIEMVTIFKANQTAKFQVAPIDRKGNPAKVQAGSVEYNSPDPEVVVTEDTNDETVFDVTTSATPVTESRTVDVEVIADADLGDGVKEIRGILTVVLEPDMAEGFGIKTLAEPTDVS